MNESEIAIHKKTIDALDQYTMARIVRYAPSGHPYFDASNGDLSDYFQAKFKEKGGMTPEISKDLGWENK